MFCKAAAPFPFPSVEYGSSSVSAPLSTAVLCLSDDAHPSGCEVASVSRWPYFPMAAKAEHLLCPFFKTTFSLKKLVLYIFLFFHLFLLVGLYIFIFS